LIVNSDVSSVDQFVIFSTSKKATKKRINNLFIVTGVKKSLNDFVPAGPNIAVYLT